MTAAMLVENAVATVALHRSEAATAAARDTIANLNIALENSRHIGAAIGIIMYQLKVTEDQALDLLRHTSQQLQRKLRHLALDVLETGWLDPSVFASHLPQPSKQAGPPQVSPHNR